MGQADFGSAKFISKQMKMRGLQKLRFYCQLCMKQCRDDNGYRAHLKSPSHLKRASKVTSKDIDDYTQQFEYEFLKLLRLGHGEKKIEANKFYNEYIQDKHHIHMNVTRFTSLTKFIQHLSKTGKIKVHGIETIENDMDPGQLLISYIDNSSMNVLRKEELKQLEEGQKSEEDIKRKLLQKQIESDVSGSTGQNNSDDSEDRGCRSKEEQELSGKISLALQKPSKNKVGKKKVKPKGFNVFKNASKS
ncbi:HEL233Cp [Eremothecium sinecaudum]|uniref:HEL233Cp n=1 Tax=Eremothecium sinecaudum TaxID=45286 RepID=A0A120K2B8_9SACH|nr:HEL233Cp [Eremothecium sinecaudum]AMD21048.1 HEL233Cp [Eremothecium sinecaudum]